jgi:serine/threonine-protein kinase
VVAAAVVLAALVVGGVAAGIGFRRAVVAERAARREAESANQVAAFMVGLFHTSGPGGNPDSLTARALLDRGFELAPPADPLVRARLFGAISDSYLNLEEFDAGMKSAHAALDAAESARPRDDVEVARYLDKLANAYSMAGLVDSIPPLADRAIALLSASARGDKALLASSYYRKAKLAMNAQRLEEADSLLALAIASMGQATKPDASLLTRIHSSRGTLASWRTQNDTSLAEYRRALAYSMEANEPMREAGLQSLLASTFVNLGQPDSAVVHAQIGVDMARRLYAPDHKALANALGRLAEAQVARGHSREAIAAEEEAVRILRSKPRAGDALAFEVATLGSIHQSAGNLEEAIRLTAEALDLYREADGPDHFRVGEAMANLASDEALAGHVKAADDHFRRAIAVLEANQDETIVLPVARLNYGNLCIDQGRLADAESLFARAWSGLDSSNVAMRAYCGDVLMGRARVRARQGKEAEALATAALRLRRGTPENDPQLLDTWLSMAEVEKLSGRQEATAQMLERARRSGATEKDLARYPALASSFVSSR